MRTIKITKGEYKGKTGRVVAAAPNGDGRIRFMVHIDNTKNTLVAVVK